MDSELINSALELANNDAKLLAYLAVFLDGNTPEGSGYYYDKHADYQYIESREEFRRLSEYRFTSEEHTQFVLNYDPEEGETTIRFDISSGRYREGTIEYVITLDEALEIISELFRRGSYPGGCGGSWTATAYGITEEDGYVNDYDLKYPIRASVLFAQGRRRSVISGR